MNQQQEIIALVGTISSSILTILAILFLIYKIFITYKKKNKAKKILTSEDFIEIIGTKNQSDSNIKKYFKEIFIREVDLNLFKKFLKSETGIGKKPTKIAWDFLIILSTSVLVNKSQGKISEAVQSIKNIFDESKKLLLNSDNSNLLTDVILKIMNLKIRPILTSTRLWTEQDKNGNLIINDYNISENDTKNFWNQIDKLRKELIENKYLYFISVLSLSNQTSKQIQDLLNYQSNYKITQNEIKTETEISQSINKIKEIINNN